MRLEKARGVQRGGLKQDENGDFFLCKNLGVSLGCTSEIVVLLLRNAWHPVGCPDSWLGSSEGEI